MRIISSFRDYYDGLSVYDKSETLVYQRMPSSDTVKKGEPILKDVFVPRIMELRNSGGGYTGTNREFFLIAFCGKFYPIAIDSNGYHGAEVFHTTLDKLVEDKSKKSDWFSQSETIRKFWSQANESAMNLNIHYNSPIVVISRIKEWILYQSGYEYVVDVDVELKNYRFQKIVDPYTAFQEISMFVGGVLPQPDKGMVNITDKDRLQQHGFDKWSFRKLPEKR